MCLSTSTITQYFRVSSKSTNISSSGLITAILAQVAVVISVYRAEASQLVVDVANKIGKVLGQAVNTVDVIPIEEIQAKKMKIVGLKETVDKSLFHLRKREQLLALGLAYPDIEEFREQHAGFEAEVMREIGRLDEEIWVLVLGSAGNSSRQHLAQQQVNQVVEQENREEQLAKTPAEGRRGRAVSEGRSKRAVSEMPSKRGATSKRVVSEVKGKKAVSAVSSKRAVVEKAATSVRKRALPEEVEGELEKTTMPKKAKVSRSSSVQRLEELQHFPKEAGHVVNQGIKQEVEATIFSCQEAGCHFSFSTAAAFSSHAKARHWAAGASCRSCPVQGCTSFRGGNKAVGAVANHIRAKHTLEKLFVCDDCGRQFSCLAKKFEHVKKHKTPSLAMCEVCRQFYR